MQIEPVVTIASLINHPEAEEFGLNELISNGYKDDMDTRYVVMSTVDQGESFVEVDEMVVTGVEIVNQGVWMQDRLYDEGSITAFTIKGREGLWTLDILTGEEE